MGEWRNGGMAVWRNGGMAEWQNGWQNVRMVGGWRSLPAIFTVLVRRYGGMAEWPNGGMATY